MNFLLIFLLSFLIFYLTYGYITIFKAAKNLNIFECREALQKIEDFRRIVDILKHVCNCTVEVRKDISFVNKYSEKLKEKWLLDYKTGTLNEDDIELISYLTDANLKDYLKTYADELEKYQKFTKQFLDNFNKNDINHALQAFKDFDYLENPETALRLSNDDLVKLFFSENTFENLKLQKKLSNYIKKNVKGKRINAKR
jgi:hypothetical protein